MKPVDSNTEQYGKHSYKYVCMRMCVNCT